MARRRRNAAAHDHRRGHACPRCSYGHTRKVYVARGTVRKNGRRYLYAVAIREA